MEHIHTLRLDFKAERNVACTGCEVEFRLATFDEAVFLKDADLLAETGAMVYNANGVVVVPEDFSIFQEAK